MQRRKGDEEEANITFGLRDRMEISVKDQHQAVREHFGLPEQNAVTSADVWKYACDVYQRHLANGIRYWESLRNALAERDSAEAAAAEKLRDEKYDRRFRADYQVKQQSPVWLVKARSDHTDNFAYRNRVDPDRKGGHRIEALHNYAKNDANGADRLPNSEILWQQFKDIAGESGDLSRITRTGIANVATRVTLYLAYPDGEAPTVYLRLWEPGTEGFLAVLGTENAKSAAFLLTDHACRIGKTIRAIQTTKSKIVLRLEPFTG